MRRTLIIATLCLLVAACSQKTDKTLEHSGNAVYYWRTVFTLDSTERAFLQQHNVTRIYCRYFDVVLPPRGTASVQPMPNATLRFDTKMLDSIEIVPTVFIMENCMRTTTDSLASRIVRRIVQMNETNDVSNVHEIQIDCDYTARSRETYYHFLQEVRDEAKRRGLALSTTIRLHQLSMPAPPADYGVLMLYNTGDPERFNERNPILDFRDVQPYLRHLKSYSLPLAAAYPVFIWQRTLHGVNIEHVADTADVMLTKRAVEAERDDLRRLILSYHLEKENINRYTPEHYEAIYHH